MTRWIPFVLLLTACGDSSPTDGNRNDTIDPCGQSTGSAFRLTVWDVTAPARKPDGRAWDLDGSYPDLYVCIGSDDSSWEMGCSDAVQDSLTVTFGAYTEGVARSDVYATVFDDDLADDDVVGGFYADVAGLRSFADCGVQVLEGAGDFGVEEITFEVESI